MDREAKRVDFQVVEVSQGEDWPDQGTVQRGNAACLVCGGAVGNDAIRQQGVEGRMGQRLLAVVLATQGEGKAYRVAEVGDLEVFDQAKARLQNLLLELEGYFTLGDFALNPLPDEPINVADKRNFWVGEYGLTRSSRDFCGFLFRGPKRVHVQVTPESPVLTVFP